MGSDLPPALAEISHSRLETFEKCPRAFWHAYVDQTTPDGYERVEAWTGSLVHKVLEEALRETLEKRVPDPVAVLQRYDALWRETTGPHVLVVRPERTLELYRGNGRQWLKDYLDHAWPFLDATPLEVESELQYRVELPDGRTAQFHGVPDRVDRLPDGRLRVLDYKTGSWMPKFEDPRDAYQLALYWRGVAEKYPDAPGGVLVWHYLQHGQARRVEPDAMLIQASQAWLVETTMDLAERLDEPANAAAQFPAKPGPLCRWCAYGYACSANPYRAQAPTPRPQEGPKASGPASA